MGEKLKTAQEDAEAKQKELEDQKTALKDQKTVLEGQKATLEGQIADEQKAKEDLETKKNEEIQTLQGLTDKVQLSKDEITGDLTLTDAITNELINTQWFDANKIVKTIDVIDNNNVTTQYTALTLLKEIAGKIQNDEFVTIREVLNTLLDEKKTVASLKGNPGTIPIAQSNSLVDAEKVKTAALKKNMTI